MNVILVCTYAFMQVPVCVSLSVCVHAHLCVSLCVSMSVHVCVDICVNDWH